MNSLHKAIWKNAKMVNGELKSNIEFARYHEFKEDSKRFNGLKEIWKRRAK